MAEKKAQEICDKIQISFSNGMQDVMVSCSVGIAYAPECGTNFQTLYQNADTAQYEAKKSGKNRYVIYDSKRL